MGPAVLGIAEIELLELPLVDPCMFVKVSSVVFLSGVDMHSYFALG